MPSARELLQQADALMRSNRSIGKTVVDDHVPVLTDVAIPATPEPDAPAVVSYRDERIPVLTSIIPDFEIEVPKDASRARFPGSAMNASLLPVSEMPPMPEFDDTPSIVARRQRESLVERAGASDPLTEIPTWLDANLLQSKHRETNVTEHPSPTALPSDTSAGDDTIETDAVRPEPDDRSTQESPVVAPAEPVSSSSLPAMHDETPATEGTETTEATTEATEAAAASAHADLAETIYYQVLQNLDLYTERALQEHLTRHLAPIIERAGEELLATLNANLGAVIRQYVAEAIEKQIGVRPASDASS